MAPLKIEVGQHEQRQLHVTSDHVAKYAEITGDFNPLHGVGAILRDWLALS